MNIFAVFAVAEGGSNIDIRMLSVNAARISELRIGQAVAPNLDRRHTRHAVHWENATAKSTALIPQTHRESASAAFLLSSTFLRNCPSIR